MLSARRSPPSLSARTLGAARAWLGLSLALCLASCFDSKRIVFGSDAGDVEQTAAVTADVPAAELTPAANPAPVGMQTPAGEAATAPDDALSAEAAATGATIADIDPVDAGNPVPGDAGL
jgi:hypothetical protein